MKYLHLIAVSLLFIVKSTFIHEPEMDCQVENSNSKHTWISIEGNIGAGKSTLINMMTQRYPQMYLIPEPVREWQAINDDPDLNLLGQFYHDPKRWSYTMELYAFYSRLKHWQVETQTVNREIFCSERSPETSKEVFAQNTFENGFMNKLEFELYQDFYQYFSKQILAQSIRNQIFIYLRVDPEICYSRVQRRSRNEEKVEIYIKQTTITKEYLQQIHDRHEIWLINKPNVIIIDGNADIATDIQSQEVILSQLDQALKGLI